MSITYNYRTGTITATTFSGALSGNASTASQWQTTRTINMSGDVSSDAVNIDGSGNITITNTVVANDSHTHSAANLTGTTLAAGVVSSSLTSVGTLTALQVDNININLNTISSTAGTDLNITPLAGQQIVLDGTIIIDAGSMTGITTLGFDGVSLTAIQTSGEGFADNDTSIMTSAAIDDRILSYSYLTGNQTITLSGDATGSGTTAITVAVVDDSHSHTGTTISALDAGDTTTGVFDVARIRGTTHGVTAASALAEYNRFASAVDMDTLVEPGQYGGYAAMTNGPTGMTYDPIWIGASASDVTSQLVVPRTASRGLAYRGETSGVFTSWHYAGWTTTAANADLDATFAKISGTPVNNQLGVWTSATQIEGDANLIWDGTILTVGGVLHLIERADHSTSPSGGRGEVWVKSGSLGGELMYTEGDQDLDFTAYNVLPVLYHHDQTTTAADPGPGNMRWNSTTPASVTSIYLDDVDETGRDNSFMLGNLADGDILTMRGMWSASYYLVCSVNGTPTDNTGYWTIPVTIIHSGTVPATGAPMHISIEWMSQAPGGGTPTLQQVTDAGATTTTATTFSGGINLNNANATGVGALIFSDPGPGEGISWTGGNIQIYESPDDLVTNTAGNLQFVDSGVHIMTLQAAAAGLKIWDGTGVDFINIAHDGTDVNFTHATTTDWNITGITAIQAGTVDADFDAITATSYGGITEANLLDKTATETVSGSWTFSASPYVTSVAPQYFLKETGVTANNTVWSITVDGEAFTLRAWDDAISSQTPFMTVNRTGNTIDSIAFSATSIPITGALTATSYGGITEANLLDKTATETVSGAYTFSSNITLSSGTRITGTLNGDTGATSASIALTGQGTALNAGSYANWGRNYSSARTFMSNNTYVDSGDVVSDQHRYAVTHASYGHTIYEQAAGVHYWYGASASVTAGNVVTKTTQMTLNASAQLTTQGSIFTNGSMVVNGTGGDTYSISHNGTDVTIANTGTRYIDTQLTGVLEFRIQDSDGTTGLTTGAQVKSHAQTLQDVGFNVLPQFNFNASDTLEASHCGHVTGKTNTSLYTLTGPTSSDLDWPVGAVTTVMNLGTSVNYLISDTTTCTMYMLEGDGTAPADIVGTCTLGPGGVATLYRYSSTAIYIWGSGLTL